MGSCNTEVSSSNVISRGAIGFSEVIEIDEDDEEGEEDIVGFAVYCFPIVRKGSNL